MLNRDINRRDLDAPSALAADGHAGGDADPDSVKAAVLRQLNELLGPTDAPEQDSTPLTAGEAVQSVDSAEPSAVPEYAASARRSVVSHPASTREATRRHRPGLTDRLSRLLGGALTAIEDGALQRIEDKASERELLARITDERHRSIGRPVLRDSRLR